MTYTIERLGIIVTYNNYITARQHCKQQLEVIKHTHTHNSLSTYLAPHDTKLAIHVESYVIHYQYLWCIVISEVCNGLSIELHCTGLGGYTHDFHIVQQRKVSCSIALEEGNLGELRQYCDMEWTYSATDCWTKDILWHRILYKGVAAERQHSMTVCNTSIG